MAISNAAQDSSDLNALENTGIFADAPRETARQKVEKLLKERARLAKLNEDVNAALVHEGELQAVLNSCAGVLVEHLNAAFARIWTLNAEEEVLELQGAAGPQFPQDRKYSKIPLGQRKIGTIALKGVPCLVNDILNNSLFTDKEWIKREKMRSFAGYPLIVEKQIVGVMCIFARHRLTDLTLQAMASVSNAIANGIRRKQSEEARGKLLEKLEAARESERRHLSRLLHDEISQQLAVASMKLQRVEKKIVNLLPEEHAVIADLVVTQELLLRNQQSLRLMAHTLHSGILEHFGLPEALRKFVADIKNLSGEKLTSVALDFPADFPRLKLSVETGIYRVVQEAVNNALKHARAKNITLALTSAGDAVQIAVRDDGCGFDVKNVPGEGIGFASMRERAEIIGGKLSVSSHIHKGTEIILQVPLEKNLAPKKIEDGR
ncbi:MAG TPA: GAF domain-containing sensor histidine kinase [Pyrinomonadaceae bacterium]|jgi:signal transduction histidine kinase